MKKHRGLAALFLLAALLLTGCGAAKPEIPEGLRAPVLMYHAVSDEVWGMESLFVSPQTLREQLEYLRDNGYTPIFFEDLPDAADVEKPVLLTFDDGYADNYSELFPLLQEFGFKATVFVIPDNLGKPNFLTEEQVKEMADSGLVAIESHTMTHALLDSLSPEETERELTQSQNAIAAITGVVPQVLSYPEGRYSYFTVLIAKKLYPYATRRMDRCYVTGKEPLWRIPRYFVARQTELDEFARMLQGDA